MDKPFIGWEKGFWMMFTLFASPELGCMKICPGQMVNTFPVYEILDVVLKTELFPAAIIPNLSTSACEKTLSFSKRKKDSGISSGLMFLPLSDVVASAFEDVSGMIFFRVFVKAKGIYKKLHRQEKFCFFEK
jgi:hypothetical protein